ncbi:MAG: hypothetical protein RLZZ126_1594 [Pseudomonadota bacterium]
MALIAAALFGISTPFVQLLGRGTGPFGTACLLYAGAGLAGCLVRKSPGSEARLRRLDLPRIGALALFGAVIGPVALAWGLQQVSGTAASLMLALEAVFTAVLARLMYGESMDQRVLLAMLLLAAGGAILVLDQGHLGSAPTAGLLAVVVATAAWGMDNSLSRALADRDPGQVVAAKSALGAVATALLAWSAKESLPAVTTGAGLVLVGAAGYGLSLRFYLLAQRSFGAARTGSVFTAAPFIGAFVAWGLGDRAFTAWLGMGGLLMAMGVLLHVLEQHAHDHSHEAMDHEHAHNHDDGHHGHTHDPMPVGAHNHWHVHLPLQHAHPHAPDVHHQHSH